MELGLDEEEEEGAAWIWIVGVRPGAEEMALMLALAMVEKRKAVAVDVSGGS